MAPDAADFPFLTFACAVGSRFKSTVLFGRRATPGESAQHLLLPPEIALEPLPYYESLLRVDQLILATPGTLKGFWRGLSRVDAVWVFGPHPFAFLLVGAAVLRRRRVVLGMRQDTVAYFRERLPSSRWKPALLVVYLWDVGFRVLARFLSTTVVGKELPLRGRDQHALLMPMTVSLVRDHDVVPYASERDWTGRINLLTVGRIDQEKNPLLLVEALAALNQRHPRRFCLTWIGTGPLEAAVSRRAAEIGLGEQIELLGFIPFGPELLERYRSAHIFVHVSLTEGAPAVIVEALASGTPVVATDVGGVARMLEEGLRGLLVPPADLDALVSAILRILADPDGRDRRVKRGLELAHEWTLDTQTARVARFIKGVAN